MGNHGGRAFFRGAVRATAARVGRSQRGSYRGKGRTAEALRNAPRESPPTPPLFKVLILIPPPTPLPSKNPRKTKNQKQKNQKNKPQKLAKTKNLCFHTRNAKTHQESTTLRHRRDPGPHPLLRARPYPMSNPLTDLLSSTIGALKENEEGPTMHLTLHEGPTAAIDEVRGPNTRLLHIQHSLATYQELLQCQIFPGDRFGVRHQDGSFTAVTPYPRMRRDKQ